MIRLIVETSENQKKMNKTLGELLNFHKAETPSACNLSILGNIVSPYLLHAATPIVPEEGRERERERDGERKRRRRDRDRSRDRETEASKPDKRSRSPDSSIESSGQFQLIWFLLTSYNVQYSRIITGPTLNTNILGPRWASQKLWYTKESSVPALSQTPLYFYSYLNSKGFNGSPKSKILFCEHPVYILPKNALEIRVKRCLPSFLEKIEGS